MMWAGERHYTWLTKSTCSSLLSGFCISASRPGPCQHDRLRENSEGPILIYCSFPFYNAENITALLIISFSDKTTYLPCANLNSILHFMPGAEHLGIFNANTVWRTRGYISSKMIELWYLQFSWGQLSSVSVKTDSRHFTITQDLNSNNQPWQWKIPLNQEGTMSRIRIFWFLIFFYHFWSFLRS